MKWSDRLREYDLEPNGRQHGRGDPNDTDAHPKSTVITAQAMCSHDRHPVADASCELSDEVMLEILDEYIATRERGSIDRDGFIAAQIQSHPALRNVDELPGLLSSIDALHGFTPATGFDNATGSDYAAPDWEDLVSTKLGDYEILDEIGRGGMGVVYKARQVPLGRVVALKVLPLAVVLDRQQVARFMIEAQAAGQLHHPHIVPIYWVGRESGVHCYSMPLIEGESLEQIIAKSKPAPPLDGETQSSSSPGVAPITMDDGVQWMIQASEAIGYAHNQGIIHRDIKPSNLLIDETRQLWITDFGLARFHNDENLTHTGAIVGTYRYMSPEQASGQPASVDQRSDIYCLGVTFYELMTGVRVYENVSNDSASHPRRSVEPKSPRSIRSDIPKDLATILMKTLAIDPADRYATAGDLADDLKRFASGQSIIAQPPTLADRTAKWMARHRRSVAAMSLVGGILLVASLMATVVFARQQRQLRAALQQSNTNFEAATNHLQLAESRFQQTRQVLDHFGLMAAEQLRGVAGAEAVRENLVRDLLQYYEDFVDASKGSSDFGMEVVQTHLRAADIINEIGAVSRAIQVYQRTLDLLANQDATPERQCQMGVCRNRLSLLLAESGRIDEAANGYQQAIIELTTSSPETLAAKNPEHTLELARVHANWGLLDASSGAAERARQRFRVALELLEPHNDHHVECLMTTAMIWNNLGHLTQSHDVEKALGYGNHAIVNLRDGVARIAREEATDSSPTEMTRSLAMSLNNQASLLMRVQRGEEAITMFDESIRLFRELVDAQPMAVRFTEELGITYNNYGRALERLGRLDSARQALIRSRDLMELLTKRRPSEDRYRMALAGVQRNLASLDNPLIEHRFPASDRDADGSLMEGSTDG